MLIYAILVQVARTGQPSAGHVASARRLLTILDVLAAEAPLGTNEIARRLGATASTVSRQLGTLTDARLVEHISETGRYRLGIRLVELGNTVLARLDVRAVARPHLQALVDETQETATLSVPADPDAVTIDFVPTKHYVQGATGLGRPSIAHATAAGKVMLAFTDLKPNPPLVPYTEHTITNPDALAEELEQIRTQGWAEAFAEREPELNAIAAPVWASDGNLAGIIALQGPIPRLSHRAARAALPLLLDHTAAISRELGAPNVTDLAP
jgi:DNA-binding IclR family transcriptional regulator